MLLDFSSEGLASNEPAFRDRFPLALRTTPSTVGPRVFERLPWAPVEEACRRFFVFLRVLKGALPICAKLSSWTWNKAAELP